MGKAKMKLYQVDITYRVVTMAIDRDDARREAAHVIRSHEFSDEPVCDPVREITRVSGLPTGWSGSCIPYGKREEKDMTIAELLERPDLPVFEF